MNIVKGFLEFQMRSNIAIPESIAYIVPCDKVTIKRGTRVLLIQWQFVEGHRTFLSSGF